MECPVLFKKQNLILKDSVLDLPKIKLCINSDFPESDFNIDMYNLNSQYKMRIDEFTDSNIWDNMKKISNDFELIHVSHMKYKKEMSVCKYNPLSRSFFKLWEIFYDLDIIDNSINKYKTAHIAEGPGGFIDAFIKYRNNNKNDEIYAITLNSSCNDIPGWRKSKNFLKRHPNIKISYGKDETGDIYILENILHFKNKDLNGEKIDLVTADGGFDFSIDFNKQEQLSYRLIFCQCVIAFSVQKIKGTFICKIFDIFSYYTLHIIWLLHYLYDEVIITKPLTSRPANSEKYIVAKGFKGINTHFLKQLYKIVSLWEYCADNNLYIHTIFDVPLPKKYLDMMTLFNRFHVQRQIDSIIKTILLIQNSKNSKVIYKIRNEQYLNAINWCKKYDMNINSSIYNNCSYSP